MRALTGFPSPSIPCRFPTSPASLSGPRNTPLDPGAREPASARAGAGEGVATSCPAPAPWLILSTGASGGTPRHGLYLGRPRVGAAGALPRGLSALALRAAREGGARPGPGLPRPLRRGHRHQLFARLLLQVRVGVEGLGHRAGVHGGQVARWFWSRCMGTGCSRGHCPANRVCPR